MHRATGGQKRSRVNILNENADPASSLMTLRYFLGGVVVVEDDRDALFFARRLLLPVEPLFMRSVVFIESVVPVVVVVPLFIVPVPVE